MFILFLSSLFFSPLAVHSFAVYPFPFGPLTKWPVNLKDKNVPIPYYYDLTDLSPQEYQNFLSAAQIIQVGTSGCIQFNKRDTSAGWISTGTVTGGNGISIIDVIPGPNTTVILKNRQNGIQLDVCHTFAGMYQGAANQTMFIGSNNNRQLGCLTRKGDREAVRVLMNLLGVASEFQRPDRDMYLTIDDSQMLDSAKSFFKVQSNLYYNGGSFDHESVTMPTPTRFAKNKLSPHFKLKDTTKRVPPAAYFSLGDCQAVSYLYGCKTDCSKIIDPLETPNFKTEIPNKDPIYGVNCWSTSFDLMPPQKIDTIAPTSGNSYTFQIDGEDTDYLTWSPKSGIKTDIQLAKSITSNTKLEFLLTMQGTTTTRGIMTIDLLCRPYPTEASEIFYSSSTLNDPYSLDPLPPGQIGARGSPKTVTNLLAHAKTCKLPAGSSPGTTRTIIQQGYSFRPFPVDSSIVKLRIISQFAPGATADLDHWGVDYATQTFFAKNDIPIANAQYDLTFEYYVMDASGRQVTQQFILKNVIFDCNFASDSQRH